MKILLSTLPEEGQFLNWTTPSFFQPDTINRYMPLGILSLATNLPSEYEVKIIDPTSEKWTIEKTISIIEQENPDILGLSAITRRVYSLKKILEQVKVPTKVVGGPHSTYHANEILGFGADAVFIGNLADLDFSEWLKNKSKEVIYCKTDINQIKFPKREFLDINRYYPEVSTLFRAEKRLPMFSSLGCCFACRFCNVQQKKVLFKNAKIVLDEMEYLLSIGCKSIHILDDNFNINRNHVLSIINEMEKRGFNTEWSCRGQVKMDYSLLSRLKEHGLKRIHVGIESLSDEVLRFFNKHETVEDIYKFCEEARRSEIDILGYFILGALVETKKYRKELPDKIRRLGVKYPYFNILFPEPDTEYYHSLVREGFYKKDYWREYMGNPIPDYEIPYPYGEKKKEEIFNYVQGLIDEFKA